MRLPSSVVVLALGVLLVRAPAHAQSTGPGSTPGSGANTGPVRGPGDVYLPLYGVTAGIAIPVGRIADDHAAGYLLGGLVEYGVSGQPYALRGELLYQRFSLKSGRVGDDVNLFSLGSTIVYKTQGGSAAQSFLTGGIAIYHGNDGIGTRPGVNGGGGVDIPLSGFSATGEARLHVVLADGKPVLTVPITVGVKF